ncbi:MAG: alpha/beta hydrolase fold domain-containing protein, partial [Atopobiaceae bacterium]|nr:alpha/beta hydrolase fold domain-containing protein [Atopobiaceae bacterium]
TGLMEKYEPSLRFLADLSGSVVLYPELRMAPDCPFPQPVDDADDLVTWVAEHAEELGCDPNRIVIAGDSAGGNLCYAAAIRHKDDDLIKSMVTFYPLVDAKVDTRDATWTYDEYPWLEEQAVEAKARVDRIKDPGLEHLYVLGELEKLGDPLISPMWYEDPAIFPRTVMVAS